MPDVPMNQMGRLQRIAETLKRLADEEVPERIVDVDESPLGDIERQLNRAIEALESRLQERLLFSIGPVVVFRWQNAEGWPVEYVSPNVSALTGYTDQAFLSREQVYSDLIVPADLPQVFEEVQRFSSAGVDWFVHEPYRLIRPNGGTLWVADYTVIRRDKTGNITHYFGYIFDITERMEQSVQLAQNELAMRKLKSPVLRVWDGVLAMPVLGAVDESRAAEMTETLLDSISGGSVKVSVLDLTGLEEVDAATMEHLVRMVRAVELLGCKCLISGISPAVARVVVSLGLDTTTLSTFATLQSALAHALKQARR